MIGNDIVDLKQAAKDSNWKRPRYLDKIYTKKEQGIIFSAKNQDQMVWLLWSMKEAAYKVNVQQFGKRFFNPKKLVCNLISFKKGTVKIGNKSYFTCSETTKDYVYTVATLDNLSFYKSNCFKIVGLNYFAQSKFLKKEMLKALNRSDLDIKKNKIGVPRVTLKHSKLYYSLSLTHHGNYNAYAIANL